MKKNNFKNKEKLIRAAIRKFGSHSYGEASLNRIIKEAGLSKGTFYFHFKNKKDLYLYIFKKVAERKEEFFAEKLSKKGGKFLEKDIFEIFKEYSKTGLEFALEYPYYHKLGLKFYSEKGNKIYDEVKKAFSGKLEKSIAPVINRAIERGELRKDFDRKFITDLLSGLVNNFDAIFQLEGKEVDLKKIVDTFDKFIDFIKFGLSGKRK